MVLHQPDIFARRPMIAMAPDDDNRTFRGPRPRVLPGRAPGPRRRRSRPGLPSADPSPDGPPITGRFGPGAWRDPYPGARPARPLGGGGNRHGVDAPGGRPAALRVGPGGRR